jgi:nicotinamide-nucleotide amidase
MTSTSHGGSAAETAARAHRALLGREQTVGCAESLTGGELAALLSATPGASGTFAGGVVTYATELKRRLLGVTAEQVVSDECALQMATAARDLLGVDWALATTGVAGPELQEDQPAGTVFIGLAGQSSARFVRLALVGDRRAVRAGASAAALDLLLSEISRG